MGVILFDVVAFDVDSDLTVVDLAVVSSVGGVVAKQSHFSHDKTIASQSQYDATLFQRSPAPHFLSTATFPSWAH